MHAVLDLDPLDQTEYATPVLVYTWGTILHALSHVYTVYLHAFYYAVCGDENSPILKM